MSSVTRFRAPHKIHVLSWALALERDGSVACHFKDCQFMALSLEEMANHYPFCSCEIIKYPFVCETCNRRTDALEKLLLHKQYTHSYSPTEEETRKIDVYLLTPIKKEISAVQKRSWEIFLEKKKYLKCLVRKCLFVTDSMESIEDHHLNYCNETFWSQLKYECEFCHGRLLNDYDLKLHIKKAHETKTYLMKTNIVPDTNTNRVTMWSKEIMLYKQGKCFVEGCQFVDNYVKILEKHYASCDGTKQNFIICCACGSWLLNEARLNEHKRCFHKDLDEEDFKRLSYQFELESENHSSLLLDEMSPDENEILSGEVEAEMERRANDLKKYNGVMNKASRKFSSTRLSPSPVFPAKNTKSIDCKQVSDRSGIQYDSDIIEINESSLDIIDIDSSITKKVLNDGMKLNDKKKRRRSTPQSFGRSLQKDCEKKSFSVLQRKIQENWPTPLQAFANEMMKENKNISTVPVQIKVDNKDWTVNVSTTVVSQSKSSSEFPKNREALFKSLKEESYRLLKLVSKKNSIRNDVRMVFDPNENRITPFHINFKDDTNNDQSPDNLDMTKFLSSDVEDSDDATNSDMSVCDGHNSICSPIPLSNGEYPLGKVPDRIHSFDINEGKLVESSKEQIKFHRYGNEIDVSLRANLKCNTNVEDINSEVLSINKNFPSITSLEAINEKNLENEFKNEFNDDLYEAPSQNASLSKPDDDQNAYNFAEEADNQNTHIEETDILCLSDINHLGEEVKKESNQQVLFKKRNNQEIDSGVHTDAVGIEDDKQDIIANSEGTDAHKFESEYIIPEIDFVENSGFRCSIEPINESDPFHSDSSSSSYDFESDTINLTEDESGMHSNDTSQGVASEEYFSKTNEDLVLFDNELPSASLECSDSEMKGLNGNRLEMEKDPLSIDGRTSVVLFYDPETDDNESCPNVKNIHPSDDSENSISGNNQESNGENTEDLTLTKKWNCSKLKKYNSKSLRNYPTKLGGRSNELGNKPSNEEESFLGFSDCSDSSNKYCNFVSACSKLGYYDDMVILNQHYEIIPPNKKSCKFMNSDTSAHGILKETPKGNRDNCKAISGNNKTPEIETHCSQELALVKSEIINNTKSNDPEGLFLGFGSNDKYTEFRRKSIEISRRMSGESSDGKNKNDQCLNDTVHNISSFCLLGNEKVSGTESSNENCNLNPKFSSSGVNLSQPLVCDASLNCSKHSNTCNINTDSKKAGSKLKSRSDSTESAPKKRGRPRKNQFITSNFVKDTHEKKENPVDDLTLSSKKGNTHSELKALDLLKNDSKTINTVTKKTSDLAEKEQTERAVIVVTEDKSENKCVLLKSHTSTRADLDPCKMVLCNEVKEVCHHSADDVALIPNESSFTRIQDLDLNKVEGKENILNKSVVSIPRKRGRPKKLQSQIVTSNLTDQVVTVNLQKEDTVNNREKSKPFQNEDVSVIKDLPHCPASETTSISISNIDHKTERLSASSTDLSSSNIKGSSEICEEVDVIDHHCEDILSSSLESVSGNRGRNRKNQSQSETSKATNQVNATSDIKEENNEDEKSSCFDYGDNLYVHKQPDYTVKEPTPPISDNTVDKMNISSQLASSPLSMNSTHRSSDDLLEEINKSSHHPSQFSLSIPDSAFETKDNILSASSEAVPRKIGRPRKHFVNLITSTPKNSNCFSYQEGEKTDPDINKSNPFDNEESIVNSVDNSLSTENDRNPKESISYKEIFSVSKQEGIEHSSEKKWKTTSLKRKPGRPPKRLSICYQGSEQIQRKSEKINYVLPTINNESGNKCLWNSSASLEQNGVDNNSKHLLKVEKRDILEPPLKRKRGRPPKRLSVDRGKKDNISVPVKDSESSASNQIFSDSVCKEDGSVIHSHIKTYTNSVVANKLQIEKNKSGTDISSNLNDNEHENLSDLSEKKLNIKTSLDPILKRKPGRPPKHSLASYKEIKSSQIIGKDGDFKDSDSDSKHSINPNVNFIYSNEAKVNGYCKPQDKLLVDQKDCLEPPLKRKVGRPPKCLSTPQHNIKCQTENKGSDISTDSNHLESLSVKEGSSLIIKTIDKPPKSLSTSQEEKEKCQIENKNISLEDYESSVSCDRLNSFSNEGNSNVSSFIEGANHKLEFEEKNIVQPPLKRKPGRPPKYLSMGQLCNGRVNKINIPVKDVSPNNNLNLSSNEDGNGLSNVSYSKEEASQKSVCKEKNTVEPPLKRKPGRPPKAHIKQQEIEKYQIEGVNTENISAADREKYLMNSFAEVSGLSTDSHSKEGAEYEVVDEKKISFEAPLKRKPGRPPKRLSVVQQIITLNQNKDNINQNVLLIDSSSGDCLERVPKRRPGRPRKISIELKITEENMGIKCLHDSIHNGIKEEDEGLFVTDTNFVELSPLQNVEATPAESSQCLPKRKPGRPRKVISTEDNDLNESSRSNIPIQSSSLSLESSDCLEPTPKRGPGRPRKNSLEPEVKRRPGRPRKIVTSDPSTHSANQTALSVSYNSFADLELLDDNNEHSEEHFKKRRGRRKGYRIIRPSKQIVYSETYYVTFNNDSNTETSRKVPKEEGFSNIADSSLSHSLNSEGDCDNDVAEIDFSQEMECLSDSDLTSKQKARIEKRKLLSGRVDSLTVLKNPEDKVKCALCGEIMTAIQYQKVHLLKHNFMSWLEGEEPLPLDDVDKMETILTRGKRANAKFVFKCEVCHQEKKSSKGLLSHRQFCGKSDKEREGMMVTCMYCGRLMMPSSLSTHIYQSHRSVTEQAPPIEDSMGPVRKAAAKCLGKIASYIEENDLTKNGEDFHVANDGDEEFDEIEEISLLYIPVQKKKTTKHLMNRWKKLAGENKELHCIVPTCTFKSYLIKDIVRHHRTCSADGSQGFSCIKCNYICKVEEEMREHVKSCNPPIMVSQSDNSEDEEREKHVIIPYLKTAEQNINVRYKVLFFKPALTWMKEIYETYFTQEPLFLDLHLNTDSWKEMDPQTSQFYNPEKSDSMKVSFQNSSWESMLALEGKVIEGNQGIAYTGGPVWGLEWCPGEGAQYLAVSSHLSMEFNFQAGSTFTGPGLIQLWSLEDINNSKSNSLSSLQFCYGVCHNDRACWNMAWCPSGGRTDTRIGLLALATTSGSIPIYAMPNPECLQHQSTRFYKPEPVLKLELWSNEKWQCSAISWSKIKPHNIIVAGFVNGMVAVWNLGTQSKLLRKKIILYPFKVFQAHHSIVTGVCLSPESDNYLATASYDKSFKYWDLNDTIAPHSVLKRGLFTSVDWLRHWMSAVTTYDNAYTMMQTTVSLSSLRGFVNPTTPVITGINSTAWSVAVNDWLNGAITSYDNGQVVLFLALRQSIHQHLDKRKYSKVILNSTLHNIEGKDGPTEPNSRPKEKEILQSNIPSNSYEEAIHKFGLSIRTDPDIGRNDRFQEKGSENVNGIYPLSSVNRVAWNANRNSFLFTAMGYQSGFLVVSKLSFNSKDHNLIEELSKL